MGKRSRGKGQRAQGRSEMSRTIEWEGSLSPQAASILLGVPELPYEVEVAIRRKGTDQESNFTLPNVGYVDTSAMLLKDLPEDIAQQMAGLGVAQVLSVHIGFNSSPTTLETVVKKDKNGGALREPDGTDSMNDDGATAEGGQRENEDG